MTKGIHQILPCYSPHDAIGNEVRQIQSRCRDLGLASEVYAEMGTGPFKPFYSHFKEFDFDAHIYIYHFSVYSKIPHCLAEHFKSVLVRYHNITPAHFFHRQAESNAYQACALGRFQIPWIVRGARAFSTVSDFNVLDLKPYTKDEISVVPVLRDYKRLLELPTNEGWRETLSSMPKEFLLFVGRICPNKAQHDLIYHTFLAQKISPKPLGLILVGGFFSEFYAQEIKGLVARLGLSISMDKIPDFSKDIVILGQIEDSDLVTLYREAKAFVCLSDHEGFCVPVVEALHFGLPVLAHKAGAVPEILGEAGLIVEKTNELELQKALYALLFNEDLRLRLKHNMEQQSLGFDGHRSLDRFFDWVHAVN